LSQEEGYIARELKKYNRKERRVLRFFITILTGMIGIGAAAAVFAPGSSVYPGYGLDTMEGIFKVVVAGMILLLCIGVPQFWFMGRDDETVETPAPITFNPPPIARRGGDDDAGRGYGDDDDSATATGAEEEAPIEIPRADEYILLDDKERRRK